MRKRSAEVLERVLANRSPLSIQELADEYGTSEKTLRNDVKEINQFLEEASLPELIITKEGSLIKAKNFNSKEAERRLYELDAYSYKLSGTERQNYISMVLLETGQYMTMQSFAEELHVSRITIVNDMEPVKEKMALHNVDLIMDPGKGMVVHCGEAERLRLMADIGYEIRDERFFQNFLYRRLDVQYPLDSILSAAQDYMKENKLLFVGDMYYRIAVYAFVLFNFASKRGTRMDGSSALSDMDTLMLAAAQNLRVIVTQQMLEAFRAYLQTNEENIYLKSVDDIVLYKVIIQFLGEIDKTLNMGLANDTMLLDALLLHIRNMQNWEKFDVDLPTDEDSSINYDLLVKLVEENAYILENYLIHTLSESIKKSIVIHLCVAIIRGQHYMLPVSLLLVCPGSRASGKYLEAQIQNYFDFQIKAVLTEEKEIRRIEERTESVDFVLSTIPLKTEKYTVYQIHPHLGLDDLNLLQRAIFHRQHFQPDTKTKKEAALRKFIYQIFDDKELARRLAEGTEAIIGNYELEQAQKNLAPLSGRLLREYVRLLEGTLSWRDAIRVSAAPLLEAGFIENQYVDRAIQVVEEYGDYIVVSEGVALAHANQNTGGVHRDCLSLLVCPEGIHFTESDQMVYLLFCFASTGEQDDLEMLKAIIRLGQQPGDARRIAALRDIDAVYAAINAMS